MDRVRSTQPARPPQAEQGQSRRPSAPGVGDNALTTAHVTYCDYNAVPPYFDQSGSWLLGEAWFWCPYENVSDRYIEVCIDYYLFGEWNQWGCDSWSEYGPGQGLWYRAWLLCDYSGYYQFRTRAYFSSVNIDGIYQEVDVVSEGTLKLC